MGNHLAEAVDIGMGGSLGADSGFIDWIEHARPVNDVPDALLRVVRRYQAERRSDEPFHNWARRRPQRRPAAHAGRGGHRHAGHGPAGGTADEGLPDPRGDERDRRAAGQDVVLGAAGRGHRRRPLHPVRDLRGRLPVQLDRHRRGHRPARAGQDVHRLLAVLGLLPPGRAALRGPVAAVDAAPESGDELPGAVVRADAADNYWKITGGPPGDGLGAVLDAYAVRAGRPLRRGPGRRGGHRPADRRAGRRGDRRRPGHPAERRPRRAVEGGGPPGHHGQGDHRRRRQLLQPDHGPGRAGPRRTTCRPSPGSPWWARPARSRGSGPCSRGGGRPGPTGSTRWC